jgi:hypothetical protein
MKARIFHERLIRRGEDDGAFDPAFWVLVQLKL